MAYPLRDAILLCNREVHGAALKTCDEVVGVAVRRTAFLAVARGTRCLNMSSQNAETVQGVKGQRGSIGAKYVARERGEERLLDDDGEK